MKYRIEIPSKLDPKHKFFYWIGAAQTLVDTLDQAVDSTEEESLLVMEHMPVNAVCYGEVQS
jgi:hypothetical protein